MTNPVADLNRIIDRIQNNLAEIPKKVMLEVASRTYDRNPKDTWLSANSWTISMNYYDFSNKGGSFPAALAKYKPGDTITCANGQPYIRRLEYEGHSMQAPHGMMRISTAEFPQITREVVSGGI